MATNIYVANPSYDKIVYMATFDVTIQPRNYVLITGKASIDTIVNDQELSLSLDSGEILVQIAENDGAYIKYPGGIWITSIDDIVSHLTADEKATLSSGGGGGSNPGGSSGEIQYNNAGAFAGVPGSSLDALHNVVFPGKIVANTFVSGADPLSIVDTGVHVERSGMLPYNSLGGHSGFYSIWTNSDSLNSELYNYIYSTAKQAGRAYLSGGGRGFPGPGGGPAIEYVNNYNIEGRWGHLTPGVNSYNGIHIDTTFDEGNLHTTPTRASSFKVITEDTLDKAKTAYYRTEVNETYTTVDSKWYADDGAGSWTAYDIGLTPDYLYSEYTNGSGAGVYLSMDMYAASPSDNEFSLYDIPLSLGGSDSSGFANLLINPDTKTSGNLLDLQVNNNSKFSVDYAGKSIVFSLLSETSEDESAFTLNYTTNKIAGNDTGLLINMTDTLSPGTSYPIDVQVSGVSKFNVSDTGITTASRFEGNIDSSYVDIPTIGTPTWTSQADFNNVLGSPGRVTGGLITDGGGTTVDVTAGTGFVRDADSDTAGLVSLDFNETTGFAIPTDSIKYIGFEYNAGSPQVVSADSESYFDLHTSFPLGSVINQGGVLHILNNPWWVGNGVSQLIKKSENVGGRLVRDHKVGGLILGYTGTRNPTMSSGVVWGRLNEFKMSAFDASSGDTFNYYYRDGSGGYTALTGQTQWSVTQYDDGSGTLQNLAHGKFGVIWVWLNVSNDTIALTFPQTQYGNSAQAKKETIPDTFPEIWYEQGIIIGRIVIKKGKDIPIAVQSAFVETFIMTEAIDHGNLTGLTDDDHSQYALLDGRAGGQTLIGGTGNTDSLILQTTSGVGADGADMRFLVGTNGNLEALTISNDGTVKSSVAIQLPSYTVGTLPTGSQGDIAYVTDATSPTYLGTLTGGGSTVCPVFFDGTNWVAH